MGSLIPLTLIMLLCVVIYMILGIGSGREITVGTDNGEEFSDIQSAVNASKDGDVIHVSEGLYNEYVIVNTSVSIFGEDPTTTTIDGQNIGIPLSITADDVVISGFSITKGKDSGILIHGNNITIQECDITWCTNGIQFSSDHDNAPLSYLVNGTYGGTEDDGLSHAASTPDGGYILVGSTLSFGGGDSDGWLVKLANNGTVEWDQVIENTNKDKISHVLPTSDGGYLLTGYTQKNQEDLWLVKTDEIGETQWEKNYGDDNYDRGYGGAVETDDGGFVATGYNAPSGGLADAYLIKVDENGSKIWEKSYGESGIDVMWDIENLPDGGFLCCGYTESYGNGGADLWVIRTDESGEIVWDYFTGGSGNDRGLQTLVDGDRFLIAGFRNSVANGDEGWLLELDDEGNQLSSHLFGGNGKDLFRGIEKTDDGGFLLSGYTDSWGNGGNDIWLVKVDRYLSEEWNFTTGGPGNDIGAETISSDVKHTVFGITDSYGNGDDDYFMFSFKEVLGGIIIRNCTFSNNINNGIEAITGSDLIIENCEINNNGNNGVLVSKIHGVTISDSMIHDNMRYGISLTDVDGSTISTNFIQRNHLAGLSISNGSSDATVTLNNFTENENGISIHDSPPMVEIHANDIDGNIVYGITAEDTVDIVVGATENWWGDPTGPYHTVLNQEGLGNAVSSKVSFHPWIGRPTDYFSPIAEIVEISPEIQLLENSIHFEGKGIVYSSVLRFTWRSDVEGEFFNGTTGMTDNETFSPGTHTIFFRVMDNYGEWSNEVNQSVVVHRRPTVTIDNTTSDEITENDNIKLICVANDDGSVERVVWSSNIDGVLYDGPDQEFSLSNLSAGNHTITVKVVDNYDVWSDEKSITVLVNEEESFLYQEIGPLKLIYYLVMICIASLLGILIIIVKKRGRISSPQQTQQAGQTQQWPTVQNQPGLQTQQANPYPGATQYQQQGASTPQVPGQQQQFVGMQGHNQYGGGQGHNQYGGGQGQQPQYSPVPQQFPTGQQQQLQQWPQQTMNPQTGTAGSIYPQPATAAQMQPTSQIPGQEVGASPHQYIKSCPACGKNVNVNWTNCLKCGANLK